MARELPTPPPKVVQVLHGLTGWTLRYFGIVEDFKSKRKRFGSKRYGRADIMLWDKEVHVSAGVATRTAQLTFRQHEVTDALWTSGSITKSTSISHTTGTDATITVANKARGKLLHAGTMTAIINEDTRQTHFQAPSDAHGELSELVLTFKEARLKTDRRALLSLIEDFQSAAANPMPLTHVPTRTMTSVDPVQRINSVVSNNSRIGPPIR